MKQPPVLVERYGKDVWSNAEMDALRKTECLCMNCWNFGDCETAMRLYELCKQFNLALAVTRCPEWKTT